MTRTLLSGGIVVPVDGTETVLSDGGVLITDDRIEAVGPTAEFADTDVDQVIDVTGTVVIPGLVNTHSHSGIIRGLAEDMPVFEWLDKHVDPTLATLRPEEARAAYELCFAEGVRAGITCTLDMWQYADQAATAAAEFGMRTVLVPYVATDDAHDYLASPEENLRLVQHRHGDENGRIRVWFGIEHLSYASKESMIDAFQRAAEYDVGFHTHLEEAKGMTAEIEAEYGRRPVELFEDWGILDTRTHLAHCVWPDTAEIELMAERNVSVAHCPTANQKLGSGVAPVPEMQSHGIPVGLASDGIKANNRIDLIQEMKMAALLQKVHNHDPTLMPAQTALRMATIDGAKALGLDDEIGSLEPGKRADIAIFDIDTFHMSPVLAGSYNNIVPNIVHALQAGDADSVMVDGQFLLRDGEFLPKARETLIGNHREAIRGLLRRRDS